MEFTMKLRRARNKKEDLNGTSKYPKKRKKVNTTLFRKCICNPTLVNTFDFPPVWKELRAKSLLCDGTIVCADGNEFKVHRAILAASSPYFKALFTNSINRDSQETSEARLTCSGATFQLFLDYAYTGFCSITKQNVRELLKCADEYQMLDLVDLCCMYMSDIMNPSNCLQTLQYASQYYLKDLIQKAQMYIKQNFSRIIKESQEYYKLSPGHLEDILRDDDLHVTSEGIVFQAVKLWITFNPLRRKEHLLTMIKCIRLGNLDYESVEEVSKWYLIKEIPECKEYMEDVLTVLSGLKADDDVDIINNYLFRPRVPYDVLFAVGGWSAGSPTNFLETYDCRADRWLFSVDTDSSPRAYHGLCNLNGYIYMIGGFDGNEYFNTVRCFDPIQHKWSERSCMYYPRCYVSVVVHKEKIYAMGGYNGRSRMSSAERYDPILNQWEHISPMQKQRSDAGAAVINDKIYIVGGFNGQEVMNTAEVYDVAANQWTYIPNMTSARSGVSLIAFGNTLYAMGGFNGFTRLASGEKFSTDSNLEWTEVAEMLTPRSNFATAILDDLIYAIGGFNDRFVSGSTTISYVEYYDVNSNQWYEAASMNVSRSALSACVLRGLPNAREYTFLRKNMLHCGPDTN